MIDGCPTMVEGKTGSSVIMSNRRWGLTPLIIILCILSAVAFVPVVAQQQAQKVDKKVLKAQEADLDAIIKVSNAVLMGQEPAPTDYALTFRSDFLKAQDGKTFVPFTVTVDPSQVPPGQNVTFFVRVVAKTPPAASAPDAKKDDRNKKGAGPEFVHQDASFITAAAPAKPGDPFKISRAFAVLPGEYDVYLALKERLPIDAKNREKTPTKMGILKQTVAVPNLWTDSLLTSSIIVADKVETLTEPLTREQQIEQPYTFGFTQITPALVNRFTKKGEISLLFLIYNTAMDADKKPDVSVDYNFYQKDAAAENGEKFFNRTNPQVFNAKTLPPQFDPALGHQLVAGQSLPLGSFPEGEYRLEVTVTDKLSGKSITHNVSFTVTA